MMKLVDVMRKESVLVGVQPADKESALKIVAETACKCQVLSNVESGAILKGLKEREALGSTGFGQGIAIPHCRLEAVREFVVGIITVPSGVEFEAIDGGKVKLIVFIVAPAAASNEHIRLLSAISQTLLSPGSVDEVLAAPTSEAVFESFLRHSRADIPTDGGKKKNIIHVFTQNEDLFREVLGTLAGAGSDSVVVLNAENPGAYLRKMPLFAGFWTDEPSGFSKIILALVDRPLTNETIRRIESITGDLNKRNDVMVTVQEVAYASGSLEAKA